MRKLIIVSLIIFFTWHSPEQIAAQVPDLETRMERVEDSLGISYSEIPPDTTISLPTYEGVILSGPYDIYPSPYTPLILDGINYKLMVQKDNKIAIATSPNGLNSWSFITTTNGPRGSYLYLNGKWYCAWSQWFEGKCYYYFSMSQDGINYSIVAMIRKNYGEDITINYVNGKFIAYGRMLPPPYKRTITIFESVDFRNWSTPEEIIIPDVLDGPVEFYSTSAIPTPQGTFFFLNAFNTTTDHVGVQLAWSANGKTNIRRLYNRQEILVKRPGVQCLYASAVVIGDYVYITTISAEFNHSESNRGSKKYFSERYKIKLTDLYKFL